MPNSQLNSYFSRVYYEDTDAGGIVYYANYLKFLERARTEWLRSLTIAQSTLLEQNFAFVVRHVEIDYLASAKLDDLLMITSEIVQLKRASMVFKQQITNENNTLLITALIKVAAVDLQQGKPKAIPDIILGALKRVS
jgi:acyl-CoA thioester hydrolase